MTKKEMTKLIDAVYRQSGHRETVMFLDKIKDAGFTYATRAGVSICIDNMHIPSKKEELLGKAQREVNEIERQYAEGLITNGERYNKVIDIWAHVTEQVAGEMMKELGAGGDPSKDESFNPIFMMADSGSARKLAADPPVGRDARTDGEAIRRNHRNADYGQFPRGLDRAAVLHFDARRPQRFGRYRAEDRELRLSDSPLGRYRAGRHHQRVRLRHDRRHLRKRAGRRR